jgi:hypothetical protein
MAAIKVVNKSNQVLLILSNKTFLGDSDGDFVASVSSDVANGVDIVRSDDNFQVCKDLDPDQIVGSDGNAFSSTAATAVSTLNSNHLNRGKSLFEVGVEDPGSASLSKTTPDTKLQLKVKSDGSGFELVDKSSVLENIGGSASDIGGNDDKEVLGWTLSKQLEGGSSTNVYRAAIRPGVNVQADVSNETYSGDSYLTTALTVRDITASITLKDNGVINSESKNIILNPADTYVTSITRLKTSGDTIIGGDIKTASGTNDDIVIDCDGTGRVRFKSEIMPHADQDLVIHSGGTGNMIVKPDLQIDGEIVTGSNDDLVLNPGGTGAIILQADDIRFEQTTALTGGEIRLNEYNSLGDNYVALRGPLSLSSDLTFTLPSADGTSGQVLQTSGAGTLSFKSVPPTTAPTFNAVTSLKPLGGIDAQLAIYDDDGSNAIVLRAPDSLSANTTFKLPASDGSDGQVIKTDGSGQLSFVDQTADTNTSLADTDQTLTGGRTINVNQNDLFIKDGSNIKLQFDSSEDEFLFTAPVRFDGGNAGGFIKLRETVMGGTDGVILRAPLGAMQGDVTFRLPNSDGSSGQFIKTDGSGNLSFGDAGGGSSSTFKQVYHQNFIDDIGTTKHYLPFKDINEQTTIYQEEAAIIMPYDGRIVSVSIRLSTITGAGNFTVGVNTRPTGVSQFTASNWTEEETETMAFTAVDDYHTFHFVFDNAQHFEAGDLCSISLQSSGDPGGFSYWYVSTIVEYDTTTDLGSSSTEHGQNP